MINALPLTIESLVAILLLLTILYCVRLNTQLKQLKADEAAMRATIAELVAATDTAERAIAGLKNTVAEAEATLGQTLTDAEIWSGELARATESAFAVLNHVPPPGAGSTPPAAGPARQARPGAAPPPSPQAIAAAARAFTERARTRAKAA